jgi:hypothetical protein
MIKLIIEDILKFMKNFLCKAENVCVKTASYKKTALSETGKGNALREKQISYQRTRATARDSCIASC